MNDIINHPSHYTDRDIECWDWYRMVMTHEEFRGAMKNNVLKYIYRAGKKHTIIEDLEKARAYIDRWIKHEQEGEDV